MKFRVTPIDALSGAVTVPGSKSHTIRAIVFASLASGTSTLSNLLASRDTHAALEASKILGAEITADGERVRIRGFGGAPKPVGDAIDTMNSGTTTNLIASIAALSPHEIVIDGDASIRKRSVQPLLDSIRDLGAEAESLNGNGCPPCRIKGPMKGGRTTLDCRSSQYLSSLLIATPLLAEATTIEVMNPCETPYIEMTLDWLRARGISFDRDGYRRFTIHPNQSYSAFDKTIPADWSSATFFLAAGALRGNSVTVRGLDLDDTQADKDVLKYLDAMGADLRVTNEGITVRRARLRGARLDLNNTPDALPMMAAVAALAEGTTILDNVAHARIKETDRITVMTSELRKMGAEVEEKEDGMVINGTALRGTRLEGHHDHRVVMSLAVAASCAEGVSEISTAEAVDVTVPGFDRLMNSLGARIEAV